MNDRKDLLVLATDIVTAYVGGNSISDRELPSLIRSVHSALLAVDGATVEPPKQELTPAVPIKKSVTPDYIICLEDGKRFKSLRRHIMSKYGLSPEDYRAKWGLAPDYPMVAPNYALARSDLAKRMGLGTKRDADGAKPKATASKSVQKGGAKPGPGRPKGGQRKADNQNAGD